MIVDGEDVWEDIADVRVQRSRVNGEYRARLLNCDHRDGEAAVWSVPVWFVDASGNGWRTITALMEDVSRRIQAALKGRR